MAYLRPVVLLVAVIIVSLMVFARGSGNAAGTASTERGKYIVDGVAKCVECHTPRDEDGNLLESEYLRGAPIPVDSPPYPNLHWAAKAPNIAGLPGYTDEEGVRLLTEGVNRNGSAPNPPMPQFRMTREDARAVVAYLKSLE
ncbi:MAG TPA: cytochrome c [Candidatus Binatia bacterium]